MLFSKLNEWLAYIKNVHPNDIQLGLKRVKAVALKLDVCQPNAPTIIVAGTNGKGSVVASLAHIYLQHHYSVGALTSPYLFRFHEQIKINGATVNDEDLCDAFNKIEQARGDILLTQFEYTTLAALVLFKAAALDVLLLEVGLGGRLDAVNIVDADVAVITSIGIDHAAWLGNTRELIAIEKAGILRKKCVFVCGDPSPPQTLFKIVQDLEVKMHCMHQAFSYEINDTDFTFIDYITNRKMILPKPTLSPSNVATALMTARLLVKQLPLTTQHIRDAIKCLHWPARIQCIPGDVAEIYDVAHNPDAIRLLSNYLNHLPIMGKTHAVFAMRRDKDIRSSIKEISDQIDAWYIAPLQEALHNFSAEALKNIFVGSVKTWRYFESISEAYFNATQDAKPGDRIVIFGSFHTVAEAAQNNPKAMAALIV